MSVKNWGVPFRSWVTEVTTIASLIPAKGVQKAQSMTVSFKNLGVPLRCCVTAVRTTASLVHAKAMEVVQSNTVSTALAGLSFWIKAALDFLGNSDIFGVRQLIQGLLVGRALTVV